MGREETCCFTGHRPEKLPWGNREEDPRCGALKRWLDREALVAYQKGKRHFLCGMAQGADLYFCETVLQLRQAYPDLRVEAAVPCRTQADHWPEEEQGRYRRLLEACDLVTLVQEHYTPGCMMRRNRYMVERSSQIIAVYDGNSGGTRNTLLYAIRQGLEVVQADPNDFC
jgi:uncharacterized phage-like protein YoqJ